VLSSQNCCILKGWVVQDMRKFLLQHGSQYLHTSGNVDALSELIKELSRIGKLSDNRALVWTQQMLSLQQQLRPTASSLVESILDNGYFRGIYCRSRERSDLPGFIGRVSNIKRVVYDLYLILINSSHELPALNYVS
jgi:hypothetical protein